LSARNKKKENFDQNFIRKYYPPTFDRFEFVPSISNSGGTIII
jgi:hypothetical protein